MRSRAATILIGLSLPLAVAGTLSASPLPESLPGTATSTAPVPSQAPAPAAGAPATPATPPVPVSLIGPKTQASFVKQYQQRLRAKGQRIKVTGRFDKATEQATRRLQLKMGLPPNGLVDGAFLTKIGIKLRGIAGLTMFAYKQIGKQTPRTTWDFWAAYPKVPFDQLAAGDLVFFSNLGHMGVYIGGGNFIHAPRTGEFVRVQALSTRLGNYVGAVRP